MADDWQCNICKTIFDSSWSAWNHYNEEHVQFKYICVDCSEEFRSKTSCELHSAHVHNNSNRGFFERRIELTDANTGGLDKLFSCRNRDRVYNREYCGISHANQHHLAHDSSTVSYRNYSGFSRSNYYDSVRHSKPAYDRNCTETSCSAQYHTQHHVVPPNYHGYAETSRASQHQLNRDSETVQCSPDASSRYEHRPTSSKYATSASKSSSENQTKAKSKAHDDEYENFKKYFKRIKNGHFDCPICKNRYASRDILLNHFSTIHKARKLPSYLVPQRSFIRRLITKSMAKTCTMCDRTYSTCDRLKSHLAKRHEIDIYNCPSCTKVYVHRKSLDTHIALTHRIAAQTQATASVPPSST